MSFLAFLALLGITLGLRWLGKRLIPLAMPSGPLKPLGVGLAGGAVGGLLLEVGPRLSWLHPAGAALGSALALVLLGIAPFLKILLGRT